MYTIYFLHVRSIRDTEGIPFIVIKACFKDPFLTDSVHRVDKVISMFEVIWQILRLKLFNLAPSTLGPEGVVLSS